MPNLLSAASSASIRILNLIPTEKEWSRLFKNLRRGITNSDELALLDTLGQFETFSILLGKHGQNESLNVQVQLLMKITKKIEIK